MYLASRRGKLDLRRSHVELTELFVMRSKRHGQLMDEAGHELALRLPDKPILLYADASRLTQIFTNLLHNAAKSRRARVASSSRPVEVALMLLSAFPIQESAFQATNWTAFSKCSPKSTKPVSMAILALALA